MSVCQHCNAPIDELAWDCPECGRAVGTRPIERAGDRFTIWRGVPLPPVCIRCGSPARDKPWKRTYYWHEPLIYLTIFLGVIVYVIIAMIVRKKLELAVPICEAHWRRRGRLQNVAIGLLALTVGVVVLAIAMSSDSVAAFACPGAMLAGLASLIVYVVAERSLRPTRITDEFAEFAGASPAFLAVIDDRA